MSDWQFSFADVDAFGITFTDIQNFYVLLFCVWVGLLTAFSDRMGIKRLRKRRSKSGFLRGLLWMIPASDFVFLALLPSLVGVVHIRCRAAHDLLAVGRSRQMVGEQDRYTRGSNEEHG